MQSDPIRICLSCGHVWATIDPTSFRSLVATHGDELARQHLAEIDWGRYRDLPDTDLGREVAEKIAAMDAHVREGKPGEVRLYRELRGVTWDRAIKEASRWSQLTREEKLALFGWVPKKKPAFAEWDSPFV